MVDNDTVVTVPPLHHMVVTAMLTVPLSDPALQEAQSTLESTLRGLEKSGLLTFTPSGLGLAVAWGLPYFDALPPAVSEAWLPVDLVTSNETGQTTLAILNAITFASDPPGTILEQNDVAFVMASDYLEHIKTAFDTVFNGPVGELMSITSIRRGFVDGAAMGSGRRSLTKTMALEADIPGAKAIPDSAELFLGFTSTQRAALGPSVIANFEALPGVTDQWPNGYFSHGTTMHLSHLFEDLETWYGETPRSNGRVSPSDLRWRRKVTSQTITLPEGRGHVASLAKVESEFSRYGFIGHSSSMQPLSRLSGPVTDNYGTTFPAGTAMSPSAPTSTRSTTRSPTAPITAVDHMVSNPAAGLHFVVFMPTSTSFDAMRQAMDGQYGSDTPLRARNRARPVQPSPPDHAPAELPGAPTPAPIVSPGRIPQLRRRATRPRVGRNRGCQSKTCRSSVSSASPGGTRCSPRSEHRAESGDIDEPAPLLHLRTSRVYRALAVAALVSAAACAVVRLSGRGAAGADGHLDGLSAGTTVGPVVDRTSGNRGERQGYLRQRDRRRCHGNGDL